VKDWFVEHRYPPVHDPVKIFCEWAKEEKRKELEIEKMNKILKRPQIGDKLDFFIKYKETKTWPNFSIHNFENRKGELISMYGTVKNSPIKIEDLVAGDCVECSGRIAKYSTLRDGTEVTRISHVKITENKGSKK